MNKEGEERRSFVPDWTPVQRERLERGDQIVVCQCLEMGSSDLQSGEVQALRLWISPVWSERRIRVQCIASRRRR